jgi:hypothetical protein
LVVPRRGLGCSQQRKRANNKNRRASRRLGSPMLRGGPLRSPPGSNVAVKDLQSERRRYGAAAVAPSMRYPSSPPPASAPSFNTQAPRSTLAKWSYSSAHDDVASIKQSRPYLIIAQYSVDLGPIFLRDRNPLLLLLLRLPRRLLFLVTLKDAMSFLPIVGHDERHLLGYSR